MVTITEDYVSFETAKLLKEKGFPQEYDIYHSMVYNEEDYENEYEVKRMVLETKLVKAGTLSSYPVSVPEPKCYCPTLQMTMKWLREVYGIYVVFFHTNRSGWWFNITDMKDSYVLYGSEKTKCSFEEICETAIKYCLKNLI